MGDAKERRVFVSAYKRLRPDVYLRRHVEMQLEVIRDYVLTISAGLEKEEATIVARFQEQIATSPSHGRESDLEYEYDTYVNVSKVFPAMFWNGSFISLYFFLEYELINVGLHYQKDRKLLISPSDLADRGLRAGRAYLVKVCRTPFPSGQFWQDMLDYNALRNLIGHNG